MDFLRDLWGFLTVRKKFWLLPLILALLLRLTQNLPSILVTVLLLGREQLGPKALHSALQSFRGNAAKDDPA